MQYLKNTKNIILCAGHGQGRPGAVNGIHTEEVQTIKIVNRMSDLLRDKLKENGYNLVIVPHSLGLESSIAWVNERYKDVFNSWVIEIHRDSAAGLSWEDASKRCGCYYYGGDSNSQAIADKIRDILKREGANNKTWSRPDTVANAGRLGWIRDTIPVSHLLEMGFMQGDNTDNHLYWLADIASKAIFETLTNQSLTSNTSNNQSTMNYNQILIDTEKNIDWSRFADFGLDVAHHKRLYAVEGRPYQVINSLLNRTDKIKEEPLKGFELDLEKVKKIKPGLTKADYDYLQYEVERNPDNTINKLTDWGYSQAIENDQLKTEYKGKIEKMEEEIKEIENKKEESWNWNKFFVGLSKNGTIQALGSLAITALVYLTATYVPELQGQEVQVAAAVLAALNLPTVSQGLALILKKTKKND